MKFIIKYNGFLVASPETAEESTKLALMVTKNFEVSEFVPATGRSTNAKVGITAMVEAPGYMAAPTEKRKYTKRKQRHVVDEAMTERLKTMALGNTEVIPKSDWKFNQSPANYVSYLKKKYGIGFKTKKHHFNYEITRIR